jgi:hypothetical protein
MVEPLQQMSGYLSHQDLMIAAGTSKLDARSKHAPAVLFGHCGARPKRFRPYRTTPRKPQQLLLWNGLTAAE